MASGNIATSGAHQQNIGIHLTLFKQNSYQVAAHTSNAAAAQRFGSPLDTKYSFNPLNELIRASGLDMGARRYHGARIYDDHTGRRITAHGEILETAMREITAKDNEQPTQLATIIVCLSTFFGKTWLSSITASAMMLLAHGSMDTSMHGTIRIFQGKIETYATAVLSRDGMCNKLENAKSRVRSLVKERAPYIRLHTLFLPPRSQPEEGDFCEFLAQLWSAQADGVKIYTRSVKLMTFALLLSEYGWQIDVFVETDEFGTKPIVEDTLALSVIYDLTTQKKADRSYVENHGRYCKLKHGLFYPTTICSMANLSQATGLSLSRTESEQHHFMDGYQALSTFCDSKAGFKVKILPHGNITMSISIYRDVETSSVEQLELCPSSQEASPPSKRRRVESPDSQPANCSAVMENILGAIIHESVRKLISAAVHEKYPKFDWRIIDDMVKKQQYPNISLPTRLEMFKGECDEIWILSGAIFAAFDKIVSSLVNVSNESIIRTPVGQALGPLIRRNIEFLSHLLGTDSLEDRGLRPGLVVILCATRLAGVDPENSRTAPNKDDSGIIGYWNGQQGLLLTPVFERSIYWDLSIEKMRPITLHNIPIMGMPNDDAGWIRSGFIQTTNSRFKENSVNKPPTLNSASIALEYRPYFEFDSNSVVATAYINGIFYNTLSLDKTLASNTFTISECSHSTAAQERNNVWHLPLESFEPGEITLPRERTVLLSPQLNEVSRFFSYLTYRSERPILQRGCLDCALDSAASTQATIIIPQIETQCG